METRLVFSSKRRLHEGVVDKTITSNLAFLIPAVLAQLAGLYISVFVVLAAAISSFMYHSANEGRFKAIDRFAARALILHNLILLGISSYHPVLILSILGLGFVGVRFCDTTQSACDEHYSSRHSEWHLLAAVITLACLVDFL